MAKRTGIPSLSKVAHEMCRLLAKYGTLIEVLYSDNEALMAALAAARTACHTLETELEKVREYGD